METKFTCTPIAYIHSDFKEKFGVPRQSGRAPSLKSRVEFLPQFTQDAFRELDGFSHIWIVFAFSETADKGFNPTVRPPRLGGNRRVGVFASRSPFRPNPIGLSLVKLEKIERTPSGMALVVSGTDLVDGTPVLDVKPYLPYADCVFDAHGGYAEEVKNYRLNVSFPSRLLEKIDEEKRAGLLECLADDPRPSYQDDPLRSYGMAFGNAEIRFTVSGDTLTVTEVKTV